MEPKFQSSFIPRSPISSTVTSMARQQAVKGRGLFSLLAITIFVTSVLLALGVFSYKFYLERRIDQMGADLENARVTLEPETINELTRLHNRIISTQKLISEHHTLSSLIEFLEISTPKTVRFNSFQYTVTKQGIELLMKGEARGYAALAFQADVFNQSQYFKNPIFSDLNLNAKGDVSFSFKTIVDPTLVSYQRAIEGESTPTVASTTISTQQ